METKDLSEQSFVDALAEIKAAQAGKSETLNIKPTKVFFHGVDVGQAHYELRTYGVSKTAETEGDLYEMITGHRSAVIDEADARRSHGR